MMLENTKQKSFDEIVAASTLEELIWMNGFLSGTVKWRKNNGHSNLVSSELPVVANSKAKITILFGTETGNAKALAGKLGALASREGVIAKTISLDQYRTSGLAKEHLLLIIISTQGDGEPPPAAKKFYDFLHKTEENLSHLQYGVIALGDSSYPQFCQTGKEVDKKLHQLSARRLQEIQLCDTDFQDSAQSWFQQVLELIKKPKENSAEKPGTKPTKAGTRKKNYTGTILRNINLNDAGSEKQTHHIEIEVEEVSYLPGDSLGMIPQNPYSMVEAILKQVPISPEIRISYRDESCHLGDLLQNKINISHLPIRIIKRYSLIVERTIPEVPMSLYDLLKLYPLRDSAQIEAVVQVLDPITPRLYSICSSPSAHINEIHITVRRDEFFLDTEKRFGLCSNYLTAFSEGTQINFYIHPNNRFRLPPPGTDMIMIGAGTGIAPYRSFVAERAEQGISGNNWLFFGDQRFASDFLYQTEWQGYQETGVLARVNTAFSRDQQEKIYIQHRLKESGKIVYEWLESGASIYVCGARDPMSKDVERTLIELISEHGNKSPEEAEAFLQALEVSDRYLKDVY